MGFGNATLPFPRFLLDEGRFPVKCLYSFPLPFPPPLDLRKKKTKRREQVAMSYVAVDGDVSAAVEVSETAS